MIKVLDKLGYKLKKKHVPLKFKWNCQKQLKILMKSVDTTQQTTGKQKHIFKYLKTTGTINEI